MNITAKIAQELSVKPSQVEAAVALLDEGATVPFIARYRKEVTGGLDDLQLRDLEVRLRYLREMEERREAILASIAEQQKLTPELEQQIRAAETKTELEDLYLPYKPKRRTKGMIAIEAGLQPLADRLYADPTVKPEELAAQFVDADKGVPDIKAALEGAKYILMERFGDDAIVAGKLRTFLWEQGELRSKVVEDKTEAAEKFRDYFDYSEALNKVPSHRALAVFRGRNEGFLLVSLGAKGVEAGQSDPCEGIIATHFGIEDKKRAADKWLQEVVRWTWKVKLSLRMETDLLGQLRESSEDEAIRVFAANLKAILLAAPAGNKAILGLDPGLRTGVKVAVVDHTGKYLESIAIYPHAPRNQWDESIAVLAHLCKLHQVELISIGNGTASRETDKLAGDLIKRHPELKLKKMVVNEAGASVYSASDIAREEFPELDVSIRGAISIARRLQDPLAELVKIEPKAIGVGQYQHDVSQVKLGQSLDAVVEDCVNAVGVDVNSASAALLGRVSGLTPSIAGNIVSYRNQHGAFATREALKSVPRLGPKCFEQAAGFLRIMHGANPLDASAVHPESYAVVERIVNDSGKQVQQLIGDATALRSLKPERFVSEQVGLPTIKDILKELEKPGRDPRPEFKSAELLEGVEEIADLKPGMVLEGTVTNVTNFGAFVDVGVHQDGLVHISALSRNYVKDPHAVVKTGDVVKVKVLEVDAKRRRIALTMRLEDAAQPAKNNGTERQQGASRGAAGKSHAGQSQKEQGNRMGSFGNLLQNALKGK
ncbi:MAG TPA: Tex family protein [Candidatus Acidoferrum sp.]|nr:Tex family protein [Candidatus Acidoferrum sp.]